MPEDFAPENRMQEAADHSPDLEDHAVADGTDTNWVLLPPRIDALEPCPEGRMFSFGGPAFGTRFQVQMVRGHSAEPDQDGAWLARMKELCQTLLELVDRQMSPWRPESDLCRFNALKEGQSAQLPEPMRAVVRRGLHLYDMTGGIFDIGIYAATNLWGFGADGASEGLPEQVRQQALHEQRQSAAPPQLDGAKLTKQAGFNLDLCGIAKGYAVDLLLDGLRKDPELSSALVEIGGEFKGFGAKPDGMPWWVELSSDALGIGTGADRSEKRTLVGLHGWACASSGSANRSFTYQGRQYSHAIDPHTFEPVQTDILSAHVLDRECWRADALATALFAMGGDRAIEFADQHDIPCLLIMHPASAERGITSMDSRALKDWRDDG